MGDDRLSFGRDGDDRTPPAGPNADVADREVSGDRNNRHQHHRSDPAKPLLHRLAALNPLFTDVGGESGPAVIGRFHGQTQLIGGLDETIGPVSRVETESANVAADDAFAQNSAGELLVPILLESHQMALADLGDGSDLLERDTAR